MSKVLRHGLIAIIATAVALGSVQLVAAQSTDGVTSSYSISEGAGLLRDVRISKEPNWVLGILVGIGVAIVAWIAWALQLALAKVIVVGIPFLCGLAGAFGVPKSDEPARQIATGVMLIGGGVAVSLVFRLYSSIFDLKQKIAALEARKKS